MHFKIDRPASLDAYLASIRGLLPAVDSLILRHRDTRLGDYVDVLDRGQLPGLQSNRDFIAAFAARAGRVLGPEIARALEEDLLDTPQVLSANHHGIDSFAQSTQSNLLFSLRRRSDGSPVKTVPVLACGSVPLNNLTYPRGLIIYASRDKPGGRGIYRLPIFPDSAKRKLVSIAGPFTPEMLARARKRAGHMVQEAALSTSVANAVDLVLDDFGRLGPAWDSYAAQATAANSRLWHRLFRGNARRTELVYVELESVACDLLEKDLFDRDSLCHQLLFDPALRRQLIENLDGQRGCWQQEKLAEHCHEATAGQASGPAMGTMFFWGVDTRGRQVPLCVVERTDGDAAELRGMDSAGKEYTVPLTPESVSQALRERRLLPSVFTSYLVIAMARGISCVGGYYRADYLPAMQAAVARTLNGSKPAIAVRGKGLEPDPDFYLSGMQAVGMYLHGRFLPAGPLEIIASGGLDEEQYANIGDVTVFQSHIASLFDIVMDVAPGGHDFYRVRQEISKLVSASVGDKIVTISMN